MEILGRGAEAVIIREGSRVIKRRLWKNYRIKEINEKIVKYRTRREFRIMRRCYELGIPVPKVINVDESRGILEMEYIEGKKFSDVLDSCKDFHELEDLVREVGKIIGKMHKNNIVHGDLTTSNIIVKNNIPFIIDFGLASFSSRIEDKAVDLHVLLESVLARNSNLFKDFNEAFLVGYFATYEESENILKRLREIEKRGRYKER